MAQVSFLFSAAGVSTWTVPSDSTLLSFGVCGTSAKFGSLSYDLSSTAAGYAAPSSNSTERNLISFSAGASPRDFLNIPIYGGESILVSVSGACTAVISYEPIP